jgi:hypothetical protein
MTGSLPGYIPPRGRGFPDNLRKGDDMRNMTVPAALILVLAGAAPGSVVVEFDCRAEVVSTGEYDQTSGVFPMVLRVTGVNEALTSHSTDTFMEDCCGRELEVSLAGVTPEAAESMAAGLVIDVLYHNVSGIIDEGGDLEGFSSVEWSLLRVVPVGLLEEAAPISRVPEELLEEAAMVPEAPEELLEEAVPIRNLRWNSLRGGSVPAE